METKHKEFVKRVLDENPELRGDIKGGRWDDFWDDITILVDCAFNYTYIKSSVTLPEKCKSWPFATILSRRGIELNYV